ncbi:hypothetical protein EI16_12120 [Hydrogenovibrio marinus]|uniref:Uncharacterized protein n=2 Tax=Hydrogenovibrio marinus TaxID=28885 RepID=A0A066ZX26_HYDMR|nr:toprim domain-containing protein [Hydrogenovibrio marinus]KDN94640.1 hypothetical protein EI16_12120 [Hydrogenovibrio marinus]
MNNTYAYDATVIKDKAKGRWIEIFQSITHKLDDACKDPGKHVPDPTVTGGKDGFRLFKDAADTGAAYANKEGALKDGFSTLMYVTNKSFKEIIVDVAECLRLEKGEAKTQTREVAKANPKPKPWQPSPKELVERKSKLNNLWRQAAPLHKAQARRAIKYLRSRGIKNKDFSSEKDFRFHPAIWYKNEAENLCQAPGFIQKWRLPDGTPVNIHKILLSNKTDGKAELEKPKLQMKPTAKMTGGAIRIGEPAMGTLSVATGVETALSVTEATSQTCWSTLNDPLLRGFIPPQEVNHLTIWADNDEPDAKGRRSGQEAAYALRDRLSEERPDMKVVVKIPPEEGTDWNDVLVKGDRNLFFSQ